MKDFLLVSLCGTMLFLFPQRMITVYTTNNMFHVDLNSFEVWEERHDSVIYKAETFVELEEFISSATANDVNIAASIPAGSVVYDSWNGIFPKYVIAYDNAGKSDTIGMLYRTYSGENQINTYVNK